MLLCVFKFISLYVHRFICDTTDRWASEPIATRPIMMHLCAIFEHAKMNERERERTSEELLLSIIDDATSSSSRLELASGSELRLVFSDEYSFT